MAADGSVIIDIQGDSSDVTDELRDVEDAAEEAGESVRKSIVAVTAAAGALSVALVGMARSALDAGMEFEKSMSQVAATMGLSAEEIQSGSAEFELLSQAAKDAGATTAFSASQAADALNYLALAGYDAATAAEVLPSVLNLAAAGGIELAYASDLATDAMAALGIEASNANLTQFGDQMARTASKANTSVAQLGEAILTVGGTAKSLAGGTTELNAALGVLANRGIKGAEGGTALRNVILSLSAPTDRAAKLLEELGVSVYDAAGDMRPLNKTFEDLSAAMADMTEGEKTNVLNEIFNKVDLKSAQALLAGTGEEFDALAAAIENSAGAMQDMADVQLDNLAGDLTILGSATESAQIALSESLIPAFRDLAQAATAVMTWIGRLIADFPIIGQIFAGATAAVAAFTIGMGAMAAASFVAGTEVTTLTGAVTALGGALMASPVTPFALAIGVGVTAFAAFSHAAAQADQTVLNLKTSIEESNAALIEQMSAISASNEDTLAMVSALEDLAEKENKTAAEKETLASLVDRLNEKVPELGLSYDSLNDSLSMTAEQIREIAIAEAQREAMAAVSDRLSEAYVQQYTIAQELESAQRELTEAERAYAEAGQEVEAAYVGASAASQELTGDLSAAQRKVAELTELQEQNDKTIGELEGAYNAAACAIRENTVAMTEATEGAAEAEQAYTELIDAAQELESAAGYTAEATGGLTQALKEQKENESLSVATTKELIDAGYGAALAIDEETGAVLLDREAYLDLAQAKLQEKIAALETQRQSVQSVAQLHQEKAAADGAANSIWGVVSASLARAAANRTDDIDAQIAALRRAQEALKNYSFNADEAVRRSSAASRKIKTQAEEDLDTYKALKAALDHEKNTGLVEEAAYYRRLGELRDQYLADESNISEYRKVTEQIYRVEQQSFAARRKLREELVADGEKTSASVIKLEEDYQKELESRTAQIANSYKLFDEVPKRQKVSGAELLRNLEQQTKELEIFYSSLALLSERGASEGLVDEIRKLGVGARDQLEGLLALSDEKLARYSEIYGEKQELANKIAMEELEELRKGTDEEIGKQIDSIQAIYDEKAPELGLNLARGMAQGMDEGLPIVEAASRALADAAASAAKDALEIRSPSRVGRDEIGKMLDAGIAGGIEDGTQEVVTRADSMAKDIAGALKSSALDGLDISGISKQLKAAVEMESARLSAQLTVTSNAPAEARRASDTRRAAENASAHAAFGTGRRDHDTFILRVGDRDFYRGSLDALRAVEAEYPEVMDDRG